MGKRVPKLPHRVQRYVGHSKESYVTSLGRRRGVLHLNTYPIARPKRLRTKRPRRSFTLKLLQGRTQLLLSIISEKRSKTPVKVCTRFTPDSDSCLGTAACNQRQYCNQEPDAPRCNIDASAKTYDATLPLAARNLQLTTASRRCSEIERSTGSSQPTFLLQQHDARNRL